MEVKMKKYKCPCCGFYTFESDFGDGPLFDYCDVCLWQYDPVAHDNPDTMVGSNRITLSEAKASFKKHGASKPEYKNRVRNPRKEELPDSN